MSGIRRLGRFPAFVGVSVFLTACIDRESVTAPSATSSVEVDSPTSVRPVVSPEGSPVAFAVACSADMGDGSLQCAKSDAPLAPGATSLIVGGQGVFVRLASSNAGYDDVAEVFSADVTVQNLLGQALGTPDGGVPSGVKVFFHDGPTVTSGSGVVTVKDPSGTGTFTGSNQPYFEYAGMLVPGQMSTNRKWEFNVPQTATTFSFQVFVQGDVQYPNGYVDVTPIGGLVNVGANLPLSAVVRDVVGRDVGGTVTWSISNNLIASISGSGVLTGVSDGVVLATASTGGVEADGATPVTVLGVVDWVGYDIELRFLSRVTATQLTAFTDAVARWEEIITGDLGLIFGGFTPGCGPHISQVIDDVIIFVNVGPIDGPSGILGQAGPCVVRTSNLLPVVGSMTFDVADLDGLEQSGQLDLVILHEMAHVFGYGSLWNLFSLVLGSGTANPVFNGLAASIGYAAVGGPANTAVPLENIGGPGTIEKHWRESVFNDELMTGYLNSGSNALSVVSVTSMVDLGYAVNTTKADTYTLPTPLAASRLAGRLLLLDDVKVWPIDFVDANGTLSSVR